MVRRLRQESFPGEPGLGSASTQATSCTRRAVALTVHTAGESNTCEEFAHCRVCLSGFCKLSFYFGTILGLQKSGPCSTGGLWVLTWASGLQCRGMGTPGCWGLTPRGDEAGTGQAPLSGASLLSPCVPTEHGGQCSPRFPTL